MSEKKYNNHKIGTMWTGKNGRKFIKLGEDQSNNEQYNYEIQILKKDSQGNKVAVLKNPFINLFDPRNRKDKEGNPVDATKIPDKLMFELSISEEVTE